jgi:hypothetical protein
MAQAEKCRKKEGNAARPFPASASISGLDGSITSLSVRPFESGPAIDKPLRATGLRLFVPIMLIMLAEITENVKKV